MHLTLGEWSFVKRSVIESLVRRATERTKPRSRPYLFALPLLLVGCSTSEHSLPTKIFLSGAHDYPDMPSGIFDGERIIDLPENFQSAKALVDWAKSAGAEVAPLDYREYSLMLITLAKKGSDRRSLVVAYNIGTDVVRECYLDATGIELKSHGPSDMRAVLHGDWIEFRSYDALLGRVSSTGVIAGLETSTPGKPLNDCQ